MANSADHVKGFVAEVGTLTNKFTRSRSSLEYLLDYLEKQGKNVVLGRPTVEGKIDLLLQNAKAAYPRFRLDDPRLEKYRPAIRSLASVWGTAADYPAATRRTLHVALLKYDTGSNQADTLDVRKAAIKDGLTNAAAYVTRWYRPSQREVAGIYMAPEYAFAQPSARGYHGAGDTRHLSEGTKVEIEKWIKGLSAQHPKWLLFPGSVAWKKAMARNKTDYLNRKVTLDPGVDRAEVERKFASKAPSRKLKAIAEVNRGKNVYLGGDVKAPVSGSMTQQKRDWARAEMYAGQWWFTTTRVTTMLYDGEYWTTDATDPLAKTVMKNVDKVAITTLQKFFALNKGATEMARNTCYVYLNGAKKLKYHKQNDFHEVLSDHDTVVYVPGKRLPTVKIDGITYGVEICLDNAFESTKVLLQKAELSAAPDILALMSAHVDTDVSRVPNGTKYLVHACSQSANTACVAKSATRVPVLEVDTPQIKLYTIDYV